MTFQSDDPNQVVFAVYRIRPDGQLVAESWHLKEQDADDDALHVCELSGYPTLVKQTTRAEYSATNIFR